MSRMSETEKLQRLAILTEMFIGAGEDVEPERLRYYGNCTQFVPLNVFIAACRRAAMERAKGFAPSVGEIIDAARKLAPGSRSPSHGHGIPAWMRKQLASNTRRERPKELGPRGGSSERILGSIK